MHYVYPYFLFSIVVMLTRAISSNYYANKRWIAISPGGFKGFYMFGVCKYIKQNYNLDNYVFSGASAGAWNSLMLCFRRDIQEIQDELFDDSLQKAKTIQDLENLIKHKVLSRYTTDDFELQKLFIGVTTIGSYHAGATIYSQFSGIEDALDCCIASSHIPFLSGGLTATYRNAYAFDGGFCKNPYLNGTTPPVLHIRPSMWATKPKSMTIHDYTTLFSKDKYDFSVMVDQGYHDASKHRVDLDRIFIENP